MLNDIKKDASVRMAKSVASLKQELTKIRTGRAHTSLLDHITVEYYGSEVPIGGGVNADNIKRCLAFLKETDWDGVVSLESVYHPTGGSYEDGFRASVGRFKEIFG